MKRPQKPNILARVIRARAASFAATVLGGVLAGGLGCTGAFGPPSGSKDTTNGGSGANPSGGGPGGPGIGGQGAPGPGAGGAGGPATGGQGGDPYAIPTSPPAPVLTPTSRFARLSRQQWSNTVRDLLKVTDITEIDREISGDALHGFDTEGDELFVTEQLRQQFAVAAEKLADKVTADATALGRLVPANAPTDVAGRGRAFITSFGQRAFRRPLTDAEITSHLTLFNQAPTLYPGVDAFRAGASLVIQAMLQSPFFLYRTELGTAAAGATQVALNDYEVASKVAFALTNTMPDDELFAAAAAGKLRDKTEVTAQATRLLGGSRGLAGITNFNFQAYRLGTYDGITRDITIFPDFTPAAPAAMREEILQFVGATFTEGRGIRELFGSPVGFVSSALGPIYGVNATGSMLSRMDLDPNQRAGLLTRAGFLASYITGTDPDIIHRGVFIAQRVLCKELPAPDPNAKPLPPPQGDLTNRERVEMSTGKGTCGESCHGAFMNPLGYAFENYDAIGKYRTTDRGKPVNAADSYAFDGQLKSYSNGVELSQILADAKETHACYVKNMMTYLHGRILASEERTLIDYYARLSRAGMVSLRDLELAIVTSDAFLNRLP